MFNFVAAFTRSQNQTHLLNLGKSPKILKILKDAFYENRTRILSLKTNVLTIRREKKIIHA